MHFLQVYLQECSLPGPRCPDSSKFFSSGLRKEKIFYSCFLLADSVDIPFELVLKQNTEDLKQAEVYTHKKDVFLVLFLLFKNSFGILREYMN